MKGLRIRPLPVSLAIVVLFGAASAVFAQSAEDAVLSAHIFGTSEYTKAEATMVIHGNRGDQTRRLEVFIHKEGEGASRILAQIVWPAFLTNMKFLTHTDENGAQERWMKTSRGVRRLSNANFQDSVFNSDFTVEDFSYLDSDDYAFTFGEPGGDLLAIHARLLDPNAETKTKELRIDPESKLIREIDYLDAAGRVIRQYRTIETQRIAGVRYPKRVEMKDHRTGTSTEITIESIEVDRPIPARVFSRAGL